MTYLECHVGGEVMCDQQWPPRHYIVLAGPRHARPRARDLAPAPVTRDIARSAHPPPQPLTDNHSIIMTLSPHISSSLLLYRTRGMHCDLGGLYIPPPSQSYRLHQFLTRNFLN